MPIYAIVNRVLDAFCIKQKLFQTYGQDSSEPVYLSRLVCVNLAAKSKDSNLTIKLKYFLERSIANSTKSMFKSVSANIMERQCCSLN